MAIVYKIQLDEKGDKEAFFHEDTGIVNIICETDGYNATMDSIVLTPDEVKILLTFLVYRNPKIG